MLMSCFVFFKQKTAYEMRISDWSSDVCSSDLFGNAFVAIPKTDGSGNVTSNGNINQPIDASGNKLVRAPDFTLSLTADYAIALAGGELNLSGTMFHTSKFYFETDRKSVV